MTYQTSPTPTHDVNVEEASSLLLTRGTPAPSSCSCRPKTTMVPTTMRAMIVTTACVVLGTLAVLSGGRGGSSSRHTRSGDLATELLRTAHDTSYDYDPSKDFCYRDNDNAGKYCWYPTDIYPCGNWDGESGHGYHDCGRKCTQIIDVYSNYEECVSVVYDPDLDYCFKDNDNPGNTVGTLTIEFRTGIGNLLVVMTLMIDIHSILR